MGSHFCSLVKLETASILQKNNIISQDRSTHKIKIIYVNNIAIVVVVTLCNIHASCNNIWMFTITVVRIPGTIFSASSINFIHKTYSLDMPQYLDISSGASALALGHNIVNKNSLY